VPPPPSLLGRPRRSPAVAPALALALVVVLLVTSCETRVASQLNSARTTAGVANLPVATVLTDETRAHSQSMCAADQVAPSASPAATYDGETAVSVHEMVGSAPLDASIADPADRNVAASDAVWNQMKSDPLVAAAHWTDQGVGEAQCGDGQLYLTVVLRQRPSIPAAGVYSSALYATTNSQVLEGAQYTTAVDYTGTSIPLLLNLWVPPAGSPAPHPLIILIHGGAFVGGGRDDNNDSALPWVARGYAVASIDYRLDQRLVGPHDPNLQLLAAANGVADAQESVRWLKAHAATYALDTTRFGAVGNSAGGAIALGLSAAPDSHPGGPNAAFSPSVAAAVSTGAYLTPGFDAGYIHLHGTEPPILMFHYETDVASDTGAYAFRTCTAYRTAGDTCDFVLQPGEGHTTDLSAGGFWWTSQLGPFLYQNLHLGS
jgi:dienelactone hydrolase